MVPIKQLAGAVILLCAAKSAFALPYLDGSVAIGAAGAVTKTNTKVFVNAATVLKFTDANHDGNGDLKVTSSDSTFSLLGFTSGLGAYLVGTQLNNTSYPVFGFTGAGSSFSFVTESSNFFGEILSARNHVLNIFGSGHWHDASGVFADTPGDYTLSLTQSGTSTSSLISFSGTFSAYAPAAGPDDLLFGDAEGPPPSDPNHLVPEPRVVLLLGLGLGLAGMHGRRKYLF